jgi:uncharacterized membrane-anchored protein
VNAALSKVPQVTLGFWLIKILATTLGETGGDAVSMSMDLGYLVGTAIFMTLFIGAVALQITASMFHPAFYWLTIVASTTVGTTLADFADRSLRIGYPGGSLLLAGLLALALIAWYRALGTINVGSVYTARSESFYWVTIMLSQTLGTALGDWTADSMQLGYTGAALIFGGLLVAVLLAYWLTAISRTLLFWAAFVLTRPLGAVLGDYLDKPVANGGLEFSRYTASTVLLAAMVVLIVILPQRAAQRTH